MIYVNTVLIYLFVFSALPTHLSVNLSTYFYLFKGFTIFNFTSVS
jgi:hypothetical protein